MRNTDEDTTVLYAVFLRQFTLESCEVCDDKGKCKMWTKRYFQIGDIIFLNT